jgi:hypothetical protein
LISRWPIEHDIRPKLKKIGDAGNYASSLIPLINKDGMFLKEMNSTKLLNLDAQASTNKLLNAWKRQIGIQDIPVRLMPENLELSQGHPLFEWWTAYFCPGVYNLLNPL